MLPPLTRSIVSLLPLLLLPLPLGIGRFDRLAWMLLRLLRCEVVGSWGIKAVEVNGFVCCWLEGMVGGLAYGELGRPGVSFSVPASAICGSPSLPRPHVSTPGSSLIS
jgi:hypothetical protein